MKLSKGNLGFCLSASLGTVVLVAASVDADHVRATPLANLTPQAKQAIDSANNLSNAFRTVANQFLPSVVAIENRPSVAWNSGTTVQPSSRSTGRENPLKGTPWEDMFRGFELPVAANANARRPMPAPKVASARESSLTHPASS